MQTAAEITALLDLQDVGDDSFRGSQRTESILDKTYGGQLFAQSLAAAARTVDPQCQVHAIQVACLEAGRHDQPLDFTVRRNRDGRSFASRTVEASQQGRVLLHLHASFQISEQGLHHAPAMPAAPDPDGLPDLFDMMREHSALPHAAWRREWEGIDLRYVPESLERSRREQQGRQQVWIRVGDRLPDDPALHRQVLAYLSDITLLNASLLPHGFLIGAPDLPRATLNHTIWFHEDGRADEWLLVDQHSPWAGGARGLSFADVFSADGRHVASYAQEGLIRPRGDLRREYGWDGPAAGSADTASGA